MAFNTAVSGLIAANSDLGVVGNNIANASTTGFKESRTEFADVYAASAAGSSAVGSGVYIKNISQQHTQGNISFTNNPLDLAINGNGFFVLSNSDAIEYTRAGAFGVDADGTIVDSAGKSLQGFQASETGAIGGSLSDLVIDTANIEPRQTTDVDALFNLDAQQVEPAERGSVVNSAGDAIGVVQAGANNGYPSELITFTYGDGTTRQVQTATNATAEEVASQLNLVNGVSATATTQATVQVNNDNGGLDLTLNGVTLVSSEAAGDIDAQDIAIAINALTNTTLPGITAVHDDATNSLIVTSADGTDLNFQLGNSGDPLDSITITGSSGNNYVLQGDGLGDGDNDGDGTADGTANDGLQVTLGGTLAVQMDEGITADTVLNDGLGTDDGSGLFAQDIISSPFVNNAFDPTNQETYNHATSLTIYDSLGNSHVLTMYFVKESQPNAWTTYIQIDGRDVGEPNPALDPPADTDPTLAGFALQFNSDGSLDNAASEEINITYWNPVDENGEPNGALDGLTVANGAEFPIIEPFNSSNFSINMDTITQFGSDFAVQDISQDGYTTGRLASVDISDDGTIFTRFTNGQARVTGQVALANFANYQGLQPIGSTAWAETYESGSPVIGVPGSSALGQIQSGALEESNVDLSKELVDLIIAQRNFQANSKTIQTADAITQSIINLR